MSETEKNTPEDLQDINAEETAADDVAAEATEEAIEDAAPQDPIEALEAEVAELKDRLLRQAAEVENTRRRAKKDVEDAGNYAITKFARELLDVGDNLRRALDAAGDTRMPTPA